MVVLDEPYVSDIMVNWLNESGHPVLDNAFARKVSQSRRTLNLVESNQARCRIDAGERVYTNSENALAWIVENTNNASLSHAINIFKDKTAMRVALASLNPELFFKTCSTEKLFDLDFASLPVPFVLKPSMGFCSVGVYPIYKREDWEHALSDIQSNASTWRTMYPQSVVGTDCFILEGYIEGDEYALDAYFDGSGTPYVLNVLRHDFASPADTSDRMYATSTEIISDFAPIFTEWLKRVNKLVGARNFPFHVEVRIKDGRVCPIEFNPLRFAGLGGTDVSYYAFGFRTYEAFLENRYPNLAVLFEGKDDKVYSMSLLNPPRSACGQERFDYEAFEARFSHVLELRPFDVKRVGSYGFLFLETDEQSRAERDFLMDTTLEEFLR